MLVLWNMLLPKVGPLTGKTRAEGNLTVCARKQVSEHCLQLPVDEECNPIEDGSSAGLRTPPGMPGLLAFKIDVEHRRNIAHI